MSKLGVLLLIAALGLSPFFARAGASLFLSHKYDQFATQLLSPTVPLDQLVVQRREVDAIMRPLRSQPLDGNLPMVFGEEEGIQRGHAVRYYLLHPDLAGCQLYFVFEKPGDSSALVGYRDTCE